MGPRPIQTPALPMTTTGRYRVFDLLGSGGMGVVYRATDETLRRAVALKFLRPALASDEECRARFLREARIAAALNHPNTCVVYEVGQLDLPVCLPPDDTVLGPGTPFIAMEFVEGDTLAARLERSGPLPVGMAIDIALQLADGLAEAHSREIVHRDLKPQNVMITPGGRLKIVDFGLAKPIRSVQDVHPLISTSEMISADMGDGVVIGTCAYMSPEQAAGKELDARSDVFSFGTVLYQMLAGRLPFEGETATETIAKILEAEPAPWPRTAATASGAFGHVVARCLRKKPGDRYTDARVLLRDLQEIEPILSSGVLAVRSRSAERISSALAVLPRRALALGAVLVLAFGATYAVVLQVDDREDTGANQALSMPSARNGGEPVRPPGPDKVSKESPGVEVLPVTSKADRPSPAAARGDAARPSIPRPKTAAGTDPGVPAPTGADRASEQASRPDAGTLTVTSVPRSSVTLDGNRMGVTPLTLEPAAGTHEVTLTGPNGLRWRGRIDLTAGEIGSLHRDLNTTGSLSIVSSVWYEVSLDEDPPEQTPIHFDQIATGLHTIRVFREGYVTQNIEIVIEERKTSSLNITLEKEP
jgi:serine/threonine protein kinase